MGCITSTESKNVLDGVHISESRFYEYKAGIRAPDDIPLNKLSEADLKRIPQTGYLYDGLFVKFRVQSIYDGDTITIVFDIPKELGGGRACRGLRIKGYDAPEKKQAQKPPKDSGLTVEQWDEVRRKNKILSDRAIHKLSSLLADRDCYVAIEENHDKTVMNYGRLFGEIYTFPPGHPNPRRDAGIVVSEVMLREVQGCYEYGGGHKKTPVELAEEFVE